MVTREQFSKGILTYIDKEVMLHLPTSGKWALGTLVVLCKSKMYDVIDWMLSNPLFQKLDIVDQESGKINEEFLEALKISAEKYGKLELSIPIIGTLTFSDKDIENLEKYIMGGA